MKTFTESDLQTFNKDERGRLMCPAGDYSQIKTFFEPCVFEDMTGQLREKKYLFGHETTFKKACAFANP